MAAVDQKDAYRAATLHLYTLMNFSSAVLHADERALQHAMLEYQHSLQQQQHLTSKAA